MAKVFGLFDEADVSQAVEKLGESKYQDDYEVINRFTFQDERLVALPGGNASGTAGITGPIPAYSTREDQFVRDDKPTAEADTEFTQLAVGRLGDFGIDEEEANYLSRSIYHGGSLVIVDVDDADKDSVENLLEEAGAQSISDK